MARLAAALIPAPPCALRAQLPAFSPGKTFKDTVKAEGALTGKPKAK